MLVETRNTAPTYQALCWVKNGGAALGTDADPNTVGGGGAGSLAALTALGRVVTTPPGIFVTPGLAISAFTLDGTSAVVRFWWYDDVEATWVASGNVATMTTASTNSASATIGCMPGSKWYMQITTVTGTVTKIPIIIR